MLYALKACIAIGGVRPILWNGHVTQAPRGHPDQPSGLIIATDAFP